MALVQLVENVRAKIVKPLPINEKMVESIDGTEYQSRGAYVVEMSRYDFENLNGRIYTKKLWENVIIKQKNIWEGSKGLMDHPSSEGSTKDVFCVYHNMRLDENNNTVVIDLYLVGQYGQDVKEQLDAGGYIELSTSGLGDIEERHGKKYVNEDTYQIERPGDNVFNASQQVKFTNHNQKEKIENPEKEGKKIEENKKITPRTNSWQEKAFIKDVRNLIEKADKIEDIQKKLIEYKEIITWFDDEVCNNYNVSELKESTEEKIKKIKKEILELASKGNMTDDLIEKNQSLEKDYSELFIQFQAADEKCGILESLLDETKKIVLENTAKLEETENIRNGMFSATEYNIMLGHLDELEEDSKEKEKTIIKLRSDLKEVSSKYRKLIIESKKIDNKKSEIISRKKIEKKEELRKYKENIFKQDIEEKKKKRIRALEEKEQTLSSSKREDVSKFYYDLVKQEPKFSKYKDRFIECRDKSECYKIYLKIQEDVFNIRESSEEVVSDDWYTNALR